MLARLSPRGRGALYLVGGLVLTVVAFVLVNGFADAAVSAGVEAQTMSRGLKLVGAVPAIGMAAGLMLAYMGLTRLAFGERVERIDLGSMSGAGLLYVLGFAATLTLAIWLGIAYFEFNPFGR